MSSKVWRPSEDRASFSPPLIPPQLIEEYSDSLSACLALASLSLQLFAFDFSTREGFNNLPRSNKFSFHWLGWDRTGWFHRISRSRGGRNKGRDVFFFLNVKLVSKDDEITKSLHRSHRVNTAISSMNEWKKMEIRRDIYSYIKTRLFQFYRDSS